MFRSTVIASQVRVPAYPSASLRQFSGFVSVGGSAEHQVRSFVTEALQGRWAVHDKRTNSFTLHLVLLQVPHRDLVFSQLIGCPSLPRTVTQWCRYQRLQGHCRGIFKLDIVPGRLLCAYLYECCLRHTSKAIHDFGTGSDY